MKMGREVYSSGATQAHTVFLTWYDNPTRDKGTKDTCRLINSNTKLRAQKLDRAAQLQKTCSFKQSHITTVRQILKREVLKTQDAT